MSFLSWLIRRWWFWLLVPPVLAVLVLVSIRLTGQLEWQREQARTRAAGELATFADLVAAAPPVDAARQERLWQWIRSQNNTDWVEFTIMASLSQLWPDPGRESKEDPLADLHRSIHSAMRAEMARLEDILAEGPVLWGSLGWIRADFPSPKPYTGLALGIRDPSSRVIDAAIDAWCVQAVTYCDSAAVDQIDRLREATRQVGGISDWGNVVYLAQCRDAVYLLLFADGRLAERKIAWLAEPPLEVALLPRGFQGEHAAMLDSLCDPWLTCPTSLAELGDTPGRVAGKAWDLLILPHEVVRRSRTIRGLGRALQGGPEPSDVASWGEEPWLDEHSPLQIVPLEQQVRGALLNVNRHRAVRAAALAIIAWRHGVLPVDQQAAEALMGVQLHASPELLPPLRYERLSPTRFRLALDPHGATPLLTRRTALIHDTMYGQPASTRPVVDDGWSLELDCATLPPMSGSADAVPP